MWRELKKLRMSKKKKNRKMRNEWKSKKFDNLKNKCYDQSIGALKKQP